MLCCTILLFTNSGKEKLVNMISSCIDIASLKIVMGNHIGKTHKVKRVQYDVWTYYCSRVVSVFFAPARYRVVKIACSYFEVVLRTMKNYKTHYSLS
jgi:hypothetical protein